MERLIKSCFWFLARAIEISGIVGFLLLFDDRSQYRDGLEFLDILPLYTFMPLYFYLASGYLVSCIGAPLVFSRAPSLKFGRGICIAYCFHFLFFLITNFSYASQAPLFLIPLGAFGAILVFLANYLTHSWAGRWIADL